MIIIEHSVCLNKKCEVEKVYNTGEDRYMLIRDMFADDINRKINGVIKVDQAADDVIEQELNEYVITRELKKHFITFFNYYGDAFVKNAFLFAAKQRSKRNAQRRAFS